MGILDDAIREHLDLKRKHGARDAELREIEEDAFGGGEGPDPFAAGELFGRPAPDGEREPGSEELSGPSAPTPSPQSERVPEDPTRLVEPRGSAAPPESPPAERGRLSKPVEPVDREPPAAPEPERQAETEPRAMPEPPGASEPPAESESLADLMAEEEGEAEARPAAAEPPPAEPASPPPVEPSAEQADLLEPSDEAPEPSDVVPDPPPPPPEEGGEPPGRARGRVHHQTEEHPPPEPPSEESLGPPSAGPLEPEGAEPPPSAAPFEPEGEPSRAGIFDFESDAPAGEEPPPPSPTDDFDQLGPIEETPDAENLEPAAEQAPEGELDSERGAPEDLGLPEEDEADQDLGPADQPGYEPEEEAEAVHEQRDERAEGDDLLAGSPEFMQDDETGEEDLWFEKGPPQDFDFEDED